MNAPPPPRLGRWLRLAVLAAGLAGLQATPAQARQDDRSQPLHTQQDAFDGFAAPDSVSTLRGHVVMTQGSMQTTGDLARLYFDADTQLSRVVVGGRPAHLQLLDDQGRLQSGEAARLDYDQVHGIAVLTGRAVVRQQGRGETRGDTIHYDTRDGHVVADGHVSAVIVPAAAAAPASSSP